MRHLKTGKYFSWSFSNHLRAYCRQGIGRSKNIGIGVPACSRTHRLFEERWFLCIELLHNVMLDLWKWRWDAGTYSLVPAPWAEIRVTWDQDLAASPGNTARLCLFLKLKKIISGTQVEDNVQSHGQDSKYGCGYIPRNRTKEIKGD